MNRRPWRPQRLAAARTARREQRQFNPPQHPAFMLPGEGSSSAGFSPDNLGSFREIVTVDGHISAATVILLTCEET